MLASGAQDWWALVADSLPCLLTVHEASGETCANAALRAFCDLPEDTPDPLGDLARAGSLYRSDGTVYPIELLPARLAAATGEVRKGIEIVFNRPDGSRRLTLWDAGPMDTGGGPVGLAVGRDITDERNLAQAREDWLAGAAHDLRSPTTTILLALQLAKRQLARAGWAPSADMLAEVQRQLELGETKARALIRRMDVLLADGALESGQLGTLQHQTVVDLATIAAQALEEHQKTTTRHELRLDSRGEAVSVRGDEVRLRQVLDNLIENAIKYSPEGGPILVTVRCMPAEAEAAREHGVAVGNLGEGSCQEWALVEVRDQGVGVLPDELPHVFERFRRGGGPAAVIPGTGLGLYTCRAIVKAHGGHMWITSPAPCSESLKESTCSAGTVVGFALPPLASADQRQTSGTEGKDV